MNVNYFTKNLQGLSPFLVRAVWYHIFISLGNPRQIIFRKLHHKVRIGRGLPSDIYIWYHTVRTRNGLSPCAKNIKYIKRYVNPITLHPLIQLMHMLSSTELKLLYSIWILVEWLCRYSEFLRMICNLNFFKRRCHDPNSKYQFEIHICTSILIWCVIVFRLYYW